MPMPKDLGGIFSYFNSIEFVRFVPISFWVFIFFLSLCAKNTFHLAVIGGLFFIGSAISLYIHKIIYLGKFDFKYILSFWDFRLLILFIVYVSLSLIWSPWDDQIAIRKEIGRIFLSVGFISYFVSVAYSKLNVDVVIKCSILYTMIGFGLLLIYEPIYLIFTNLHQGTYWTIQNAILKPGVLYHQATVGWMYGLTLFVSLSLVKKPNTILRRTAMLGCFVSILIIIFSHSRGTYLGVLSGLFYFLTMRNRSGIPYYVLALVLGVLLFSGIYFFADIEMIDRLVQRHDSGRLLVWENAVYLFLENPMFGEGFGSTSIHDNGDFVAMHYHSLYLGMLVYGGIVGLALFLVLIASVVRLNYGIEENRSWYSVLIMSLVVFLFDVNHVLTYPSAELYIFLLPVLTMLLNRLRLGEIGALEKME